MSLQQFFKYISDNNNNTLFVIENLIEKYKYKILNDSLANDVRTIKLYNNNEYITIQSQIVIDDNFNKQEYIDLDYKVVKKTLNNFKFIGLY
jgi:phosphopantetheine adenylyltransferase